MADRAALAELGLPIQPGDVDLRTFRDELPRADHGPPGPTPSTRATTSTRPAPTSTASPRDYGACSALTDPWRPALRTSRTTPPTAASRSRSQIQNFLDPSRTTLEGPRVPGRRHLRRRRPGGNANGLVYNNRAGKRRERSQRPGLRARERPRPHQEGGAIEPLVLRANAGELIRVTLTNKLNPNPNTAPFNQAEPIRLRAVLEPDQPPSKRRRRTRSACTPQLVSYDVNSSNGFNVGFNGGTNSGLQTAAPGQSVTYVWYAGDFHVDSNGQVIPDRSSTAPSASPRRIRCSSIRTD